MLERSETKWLDPLTRFKLFEGRNVAGPSDPIPQGPKTSRSRKTPRDNDGANENYSDCSTSSTACRLPPLLANDALVQAVSQVQLSMDGGASPHIFKLFVVLVEPPPGLDLSALDGLHDYLTQLLVKIGSLVNNGIRMMASHCWWALLGKRSTPNISWV